MIVFASNMYICSSTILYVSAVAFLQVYCENNTNNEVGDGTTGISNNNTNISSSSSPSGSQNHTTSNEFKHAKLFKIFNSTSLSNMPKEVVNQVISEKICSSQYSLMCLKLDISKLLDKLESAKSFQIYPGVSLISSESKGSTDNSTDFPIDLAISSIRSGNSDNNVLNSYLKQKVGKYLRSLTVRVNLLDNPIVHNLKRFTYDAYRYIFHPAAVEETGRSKKGKHDHHAAIWSAAMLAALGLSGLAALAGKAFLTGALALILSIACLLKSCHRGHKAAHYEIITKPGHLHDVEHIGLTSGLSSSPYAFARQFLQDRNIPAFGLFDNEASDEREMESNVIPVRVYHQSSANIPPHQLVHR